MICVTGIGIVTAIGINYDAQLGNLRAGRSGIKKTKNLKSKYAETFHFGELNNSTEELLELTGIHNIKGLTRTDALANKAFFDAVTDAGLSDSELSSHDTVFISASTVGGMCEHGALYHDVQLPQTASPFINSYQYASHAFFIAQRYGLKGYTNTINTACSSSSNAIMLGARLILSGRAKRAVVGGVDALSKYTVNGFNALRILSNNPCKPFDKSRNGLSLGEGAAYLVLEKSENIVNKKTYAVVSGYGNANDTFHQSSLSEDAIGVVAAMKKALNYAGLSGSEIGYINTHGTATENNDEVELLGLSKVFNPIPPYNSTKSFTGHTLGAAGAVEAVFSIMSLLNNELYPSLNCDNPIGKSDEQPILSYTKNVSLNHVLSNSFGFGGNCTSLIFSKY